MRRPPLAWLLVMMAYWCGPIERPPGRVKAEHHLSKQEYMEYDRQVSSWYDHSPEQLDAQQVHHDDYLHRTIKSIRHTVAIELTSHHYDDAAVIVQARGPMVNESLCATHLDILAHLADWVDAHHNELNTTQQAPLSAIEFFDSYGHVPRSVLAGNYRWPGSYHSCVRARIPAQTAHKALMRGCSSSQRPKGAQCSRNHQPAAIDGTRYCVAHLRAKTWPKKTYYDERVTIELGVCLPDSCDTTTFTTHPKLIDHLARFNLRPPYSTDRYQVTELYCLPDERSPLRQLTLGSWLLLLFLALWTLALAYSDHKYNQRESDKRRPVIDIVPYQHPDQPDGPLAGGDAPAREGAQNLLVPQSASGASSLQVSPANSDVEENDGDFRGIRPIASLGRGRRRAANTWWWTQIDWLAAFSLTSNFKFLFGTRRSEKRMRQKQEGHDTDTDTDTDTDSDSDTDTQIEGIRCRSTLTGINRTSDKDAARGQANKVNIRCLDGIKVIGTIWIIMAHTLMFGFGLLTDLRHSKDYMLDFGVIAMINGLQVVGLFYMIAGTLVSYLAFSKAGPHIGRWRFWVLAMVQRYLRLIPLYFLVYWFAKHLAPFTSHGPMWLDYRTDSQHYRSQCQREPWTNMLFMAAGNVKIPNHCLPQAWYLSDDFRTLLVLPVYVYLIARDQRAGYLAILATIVYAFFSVVHRSKEASIDFRQIVEWKPHVFALLMDRFHQTYTHFAIRLSTYLVGILAGHLLYLYEEGRISWPRRLERHGLKVAITNAILLFFGAPILSHPLISGYLPDPRRLDSSTIATLIPFFKTSMEASMLITIIMLCTGGGCQLVKKIFNSQTAKVLSNLSYAVYLVHIEVVFKLPYEYFELSYTPLLTYGICTVVISYLIALALYAGYEMPVSNIMRYLFKRIDPTK